MAAGLLAGAGLGLQVALTRHFSFLYWYHCAFLVVGVGLLGLGAAGSLLALGGSVQSEKGGSDLAAVSSAVCGLCVLLFLQFGPLIDLEPFALLEKPSQALRLLALELLVLPIFIALGMAQVALLSAYKPYAPRVYGADLLGPASDALRRWECSAS